MPNTMKGTGVHGDDGSFTFTPDPTDGGGGGGTPPPGGGYDLSRPPFSAASLWNQAIRSGASYVRLAWPSPGATPGNYEVTPQWGVYVAVDSDPMVSVDVPASWGWPAGPINIRVPAGVGGGGGGGSIPDNAIVIISGDIVWNFWRFHRTSDTTATAEAYGKAHVTDDTGWGFHQTPTEENDWQSNVGAGVGAAGNSEFAGMLIQAETDAGPINHALQMALSPELLLPGHIDPPAIANDGTSPSGFAKEGQLLGIPPKVNAPGGLSPLGRKVFDAMKRYGVYITERGGEPGQIGQNCFRSQQNAYDDATINALRSDVQKLFPLLQAVS